MGPSDILKLTFLSCFKPCYFSCFIYFIAVIFFATFYTPIAVVTDVRAGTTVTTPGVC